MGSCGFRKGMVCRLWRMVVRPHPIRDRSADRAARAARLSDRPTDRAAERRKFMQDGGIACRLRRELGYHSCCKTVRKTASLHVAKRYG